jgi:hypothetical protein
MPKIWVKKSWHSMRVQKKQGQIFGFFFYSSAISFRFMDSRITTHTHFSLNSRIIQLCSQLRTCNNSIPAILLGLTLGTSVAVFVACLVLIQIIQSAVTQPLIQKRMLSIPPALIIFGQVVMGLMAGFWGGYWRHL